MIKLYFNQIEDSYARENFERLSRFLNEFDFFRGEWKFFEVTFTGAVTNFQFKHNLAFQPKDILQTSKTGAGSITFNYDRFTREYIDITTTGACVVRFFAGRYKSENQ